MTERILIHSKRRALKYYAPINLSIDVQNGTPHDTHDLQKLNSNFNSASQEEPLKIRHAKYEKKIVAVQF